MSCQSQCSEPGKDFTFESGTGSPFASCQTLTPYELWLQPGRPDAAYLVSVDDPKDVERWPAAKDGVGCA